MPNKFYLWPSRISKTALKVKKKHMKRLVCFQFKSKLIENGQIILTVYSSYKSWVGDVKQIIIIIKPVWILLGNKSIGYNRFIKLIIYIFLTQ